MVQKFRLFFKKQTEDALDFQMSNEELVYKKNFEKITNKKLINVSNFSFGYVEHIDYVIDHPLKEYFFVLHDTSINAEVTLKWASMGFFFFDSISKTIKETAKSEESLDCVLGEKKNIIITKHQEHELWLDSEKINNISDFINLMNSEFYSEYVLENKKINFKLILNLDEYILLQNTHIPIIIIQ